MERQSLIAYAQLSSKDRCIIVELTVCVQVVKALTRVYGAYISEPSLNENVISAKCIGCIFLRNVVYNDFHLAYV